MNLIEYIEYAKHTGNMLNLKRVSLEDIGGYVLHVVGIAKILSMNSVCLIQNNGKPEMLRRSPFLL